MRALVFGENGWIGGQMIALLRKEGVETHTADCRLEDRGTVLELIKEISPTHVFNCAGVTGRPNVDWCETNQKQTVRSNIIGTLNLLDCCDLKGIHVTNFATGCMYVYDDQHPIRSGKGFTEADPPNFFGSYYSKTKAMAEELSKAYDNVLTLRLRMPVSDDLHPRNFVTKITKYEKVVDVPNSNSILHDLLPVAILLASHSVSGIYNFTNPGAISHNEVLTLYRDKIDPSFKWTNFSLEEQAKVIRAGRSNCELDTSKLERKVAEYGLTIPEVHLAYNACFDRLKATAQEHRD
ncbi:hypothetical protein PYCC9005_001060 [Savitreella phatthalungensis]